MKRPAHSVLWATVIGLVIAATSAQGPNISPASPTTTSSTTSSRLSTPTLSPIPTPTTQTAPTTTTTATPTPSPTGSPTPTPGPVSYDVKDGKNRTCILFEAYRINVTVSYKTENLTIQTMVFNLTHANSGVYKLSSCSRNGRNANLTVNWTTPSSLEQYLTFFFTRQTNTWKLGLITLTLHATDKDFPDIEHNETSVFHFKYEKVVFENEYERSYKCDKSQSFSLSNENPSLHTINETTVELFPTWTIQAFEFRKNGTFGNPRMCPQSVEKNVKLPAIVGGVLLLLLTAVIVVYIISRFRRRRLTSYERLN